jgi:hypothetical protein
MPEYHAGDAKLHIVPDASKFKSELEAKLKEIKVDYTVRVNLELAQAKADVERFRVEESGKRINQALNVQFTRAREEMAAFRAEQRANAINVPVKVDTASVGSARSELSALAKQVDEVISGFGKIGKVVGITALVADVPAAVTALASLTQAIGQLSGAALVLPGAIAAAGASIGTLALGISGVKEAFTALSTASDESATTQARNAQTMVTAQNSLRNAVFDETQAQKGVRDARRDALNELRDLNLEMRSGVISEAQAVNDAAKARRDLAQGRFKDSLDARDAQLRVLSADERVADVREKNRVLSEKKNDADVKGVEGSDKVTAANERLVRSMDSVAAAQFALSQAMTGDSAMQKANDLLSKLSPNAAEFVKTLIALKPQWDDLKKTVSGNLFEGASLSFTQFIDKVLPNIKTGMGGIATAWNANIKGLLTSLGSDQSKGLLDRILGNTAEAQKRFGAAIDPLVRGIGQLAAAGTDVLPHMADSIAKVAERFANFIDAADKDGRLKKWMDEGLKGFSDLGNTLLNVGKIFHDIHEALGGPGLLDSVSKLTEKWHTFLSSAEGQQKLKDFFAEGKREMDEWRPIIGDLIKTLPAIWDGAKTAMDIFMPILREFTGILKDSPNLVSGVVTAFAAWKTITAFDFVLNKLGDISTKLGRPGKGKGGKGGGGRGVLGRLALLGGAVALDELLEDSDTGGGGGGGGGGAPPGSGGPGVPPGTVPTGQLPVGSPAPFSNIPILPAGPTGQVLGGAALGAATGGPWGAVLGAFAGLPGVPERGTGNPVEDAFNTFVFAIPMLDDNNLKPLADAFGMSVPDLKKTSRDDLHKRFLDIVAKQGGIPTKMSGGPTNAGLALLHDDEFVLSDRAQKYPMDFKNALNEGRIDPKSLPHFRNGGQVDWGQTIYGPTGPPQSGGGGEIGDITSHFMSGLQGVQSFTQGMGFGNAPLAPAGGDAPGPGPAPGPLLLWQRMLLPPTGPPAAPAPAPTPAAPAAPAVPSPADAGLGASAHLPATGAAAPGPAPDTDTDAPVTADNLPLPAAKPSLSMKLFGMTVPIQLPGAPAGTPAFTLPGDEDPNYDASKDFTRRWFKWLPPKGSPLDFGQILAGMPEKLQPQNIAMQFGKTLYTGALSTFGLENSILSPQGKYAGDISQGLSYYGENFGQDVVNKALGIDTSGATPFASDPSQFDVAPTAGHPTPGVASGTSLGPGVANEGRLQVKTIEAARAISAAFPQIKTMGGYRQDALKWHPSGYAVDVMIPGAGGLNDPTPPAGKALGDQIYAWVMAHQQELGVDYVLWQVKDHYNHLHVNTIGGGYPTGNETYTMPGGAAPTDAGGRRGGRRQGGAATGSPQSIVHAAMLAAGWDEGQWSALNNIVSHESSWNPTNVNPNGGAFGLFQFLGGTKASYLGWDNPDVSTQAMAGMRYIKDRYGSPSAAWNFWQGHQWYDEASLTNPMFLQPGVTIAHNDTGKPEAIVGPTPPPTPPPVDTGTIAGHLVQPPSAGMLPAPAPALTPGPGGTPEAPGPTEGQPAPPAPEPGAPGTQQAPQLPVAPSTEGGGIAGPQGHIPTPEEATKSHVLPALETGIKSGASAIGTAASTAISAAGGAFGGGAAGALAAGLINEGGKAIVDVANVASSFLVGTVSNIGGTTGSAYGRQYRPAQAQPATAANHHTTNYNGGIVVADPQELRRELDLRDAQQHQSMMANRN